MSTGGPQQLTGYRLRGHADLISRLRQTQTRRGTTHAAIARQTHVARQQVSAWLAGTSGRTVGYAFDLAHALGYDLALIPREDTP